MSLDTLKPRTVGDIRKPTAGDGEVGFRVQRGRGILCLHAYNFPIAFQNESIEQLRGWWPKSHGA